MPLNRARIAHRDVILEIVGSESAWPEQPVPTPIDKVGSGVEIGAFFGLPVQLHQRALNLRVAVDAVDLPFAGPERPDDKVGHPAGHLQQPRITTGAMQGDRRLHQMPRAVQLVTPLQVLEPSAWVANLEVGVEVAVLSLRLSKQFAGGVNLLL